MNLNFDNHPCFSSTARHEYGRIHLPVAPRCNIQCKFCNRKFDCVNESRPGVTSSVLEPEQALAYLDNVIKINPKISVVGIAGPGDPFANAEQTMQTLRLVREKYPDMMLCVASNGLNVTPFVDELAELQVSHVTLTINGIKPEIVGQVYSFIRHEKRTRKGTEAAELLINNQLEALKALKRAGIVVKINTIIIPGINDFHIEELSEFLANLGADIQNCIPVYPVEGTPFAELEAPDPKTVAEIRLKAGDHIKQMRHCARCRADAVGMIGQNNSEKITKLLQQASEGKLEVEHYEANRPNVAVGSLEGVLVNQHLGDAEELLIYGEGPDGFKLLETRKTPERGSGVQRWEELSDILSDCRSVLVSGAGESPKSVLAQKGIRVDVMEGLIEEGLDSIYKGIPIRSPIRYRKCGEACSGDGGGCG